MTNAAYSLHPTPVGDALVVVTDDGLVALDVLDDAGTSADPVRDALTAVAMALRTLPGEDPAATAQVTRQLDEYFAGTRRDFELRIDWRLVRGFVRDALEQVCAIPYGETASYAEIAIAAGSPGAHRAVGTACARTPISIVVPAHRVVRADGTVGQYGRHPERKRRLLELEARNAAGV